jgi:hypothetical protein
VEVGGCASQGCGGSGSPMTRGTGEVADDDCAAVLNIGAEIPVAGDDRVSPWPRWGMESTGAWSSP